ncbi:MAG: serine/threonine-protein kinase [Phycisphaerales bacterium]
MERPERVRNLAEHASRLAPDERVRFIDRECGGDASLRAEVAACLHDEHDARGSGGVGANDVTAISLGDAAIVRGPRETPGTCIGPYKLLQVIGEGGFGTVFMAAQEKPVARTVALKIIKLGMDTRQVVARFEQERQALALMDHPNIARVYDAGATETGRPYFVMELVKGDPIVEYCDRNGLSIPERLDLFAQACQAVQHAHTKGIIHRDIKPSNVLVTMQDGRPSPKVIDFGIAKATSNKLTERTLFTEQRQLIGTPEYMSPEQAEGSLDIDTRTDVYSLGVLLYELLTSTTPFSGRDLRSAEYGEIQRIIREVDPPRPSARLSQHSDTINRVAAMRHTEPGTLGVMLRGELDWIVMKALEKDRQRRYETAASFAMDVRRYLAGEAVLAAPPSASYRLRKTLRRHRVLVSAASAVVIALVVGAAAFAWQARVAGEQRDIAVAATHAEAEQRRIADAQRDRAVTAEAEAIRRADELAKVAGFQASMLKQLDTADAGAKLMKDVLARYSAALEKSGVSDAERGERARGFARDLELVNATDTAAELIDRTILEPAVAAIDVQFKDQPAVDAKMRRTLAELYRALGLYDKAQPLAEAALATSRRALGDEHRDTLECMNEMAMLLDAQGRLDDAERAYRDAFDASRRATGEDSEITAIALCNLGNCLRSRGNNDEAEPLLRKNLEQWKRIRGDAGRDTLIAMNCLGYLFISQGKLNEAEPLWRDAYERGRASLGDDDRDVLVWRANYAGLLQGQGKLREAEPLYREALTRYRRIRGEEHPDTLTVMTSLAGVLHGQGRSAEAVPLCREACEKATRTLGPEHPQSLYYVTQLGVVLAATGQTTESEERLRTALAGLERVMGADHPTTLDVMGSLADVLSMTGARVEAETLHRATLEKRARVLGPEHPLTLVSMNNLANLLMDEDRFDEAEPLILKALELRRRISGEEHPETLVARSNLGTLLEGQGKFAEAEATDRDVLEKLRRVLGDDHRTTINAMSILAQVLRASGRPEEAEPLGREALERAQRTLGEDHLATAGLHIGLGRTLTSLARFPEAEAELLEAQRLLDSSPSPPQHWRRQSADALSTLYDAWHKAQPGAGRDVKAAEWRRAAEAASGAERPNGRAGGR